MKKVGSVYNHDYAGNVIVTELIDEKHCRVKHCLWSKLNEEIHSIRNEEPALAAWSLMTLVEESPKYAAVVKNEG